MNNYPKAPFQKGDDVQVSHDGKVWKNGKYLCSSSSRYYAYTYDYDGGPNPYKYCRYASLTMNDKENLQYIHDRIVNVYGETENVDFLIKMREIIDNI